MEKLTKAKKIKRKRKHGFFQRQKKRTGRKVLKHRLSSKRKRVTV